MTKQFIPYTYLIGWSKLNKWYYGSQYANHKRVANPSDLWTIYFTSSKLVKAYRKEYGEPDVIEVRRTFKTAIEARLWEARVLAKFFREPNWLNQHDGNGKFHTAGKKYTEAEKERRVAHHRGRKRSQATKDAISNSMKGKNTGPHKPHSEETLAKMRETKAKNPQHPNMLGKHHREESKLKSSESNKAAKAAKAAANLAAGILTTAQVAEMLGVTPYIVRKMTDEGKIKADTSKTQRVYRLEDIKELC